MDSQVAAILNVRELAIPIGAVDGVKKGMVFAVSSKPRLIIDPDSKEELGQFKREKVRVRIVEVEERYSIGRTFEQNTGGSFAGLASLGKELGLMSGTNRTRTLSAGDQVGFEALSDRDSYVSIGDPVTLISDPEPPSCETHE